MSHLSDDCGDFVILTAEETDVLGPSNMETRRPSQVNPVLDPDGKLTITAAILILEIAMTKASKCAKVGGYHSRRKRCPKP